MKAIVGIGVTLFAASAVLVAQKKPMPDVRRIVESSMAATQRQWRERIHYSYVERAESWQRDSDGRVKSQDVEISRTTLVNDVPFEQLVERNGQPPSAGENSRQRTALAKVKRETAEQRAEQLREQDEATTSLVQEVPKAFDFQFVGEDVIDGRAAYMLRATPRPAYQARGMYGKVFSKVEGTLWIDAEDLVWMKVDGQVVQTVSIGLFLVRMLRGSQVKIEQARLDDGSWVPARVEVRAAAKLFLVKNLAIEKVLTYSDYRRAAAGAAALTPQFALRVR